MSTVTEPAVTTWTIDPVHTSVEFSVRHLMIAAVKGRFSGVTGSVKIDDRNQLRGEADITIDAATIDTREPQRDAHLRSADFFEVESYPTIEFRSKRIAPVNSDRFELVGDLTMHGVTKEVTLDVTSHGRARDPWGGERAGFAAATSVKRSEFGLTWNQLLETGGFAVSDEVKISLDVELVKA